MTSQRSWGWFYLGAFGLLVLAAQLGLLPGWLGPLTRHGIDKALHFALFGGIGFVVGGMAASQPPARQRLIWLSLLLACGLDELIQTQLPHRTADPLDLLADVVGITSFFWWSIRRHSAGPSSSSVGPPPPQSNP